MDGLINNRKYEKGNNKQTDLGACFAGDAVLLVCAGTGCADGVQRLHRATLIRLQGDVGGREVDLLGDWRHHQRG